MTKNNPQIFSLSRALPVIVFVILSCIIPSQSQARLLETLGYQQLLDKSDLVVLAVPRSKTTDTKELSHLPKIWHQNKYGLQGNIKSVGVETPFTVSVVLKGDKTVKTFTLHHYREAHPPEVELEGPLLVSFDPSDPTRRSPYLLFLVREPDGRFAPTGGQTDPGFEAIHRLSYEPAK
jgi:hypothetical protein